MQGSVTADARNLKGLVIERIRVFMRTRSSFNLAQESMQCMLASMLGPCPYFISKLPHWFYTCNNNSKGISTAGPVRQCVMRLSARSG